MPSATSIFAGTSAALFTQAVIPRTAMQVLHTGHWSETIMADVAQRAILLPDDWE